MPTKQELEAEIGRLDTAIAKAEKESLTMPTEQELEAEIERLEAAIAEAEEERDEFRDALLEADDERQQAQRRASPEYEQELVGKVLAMDHHDLFKAIAPTLGLLPRAVPHAWKILQADGLYAVAGKPAPAAIEHALAKLRESHGFMFSASAAPPERWNPAGPVVFTNSNGTARPN